MKEQLFVVFVTCPNEEVGKTLAKNAVESHLAACVNILPSISSVYYWDGAVQSDSETLLIFKTSEECLLSLEQFIDENHPYDTPEFVAIPSTHISKDYLKWAKEYLRG